MASFHTFNLFINVFKRVPARNTLSKNIFVVDVTFSFLCVISEGNYKKLYYLLISNI